MWIRWNKVCKQSRIKLGLRARDRCVAFRERWCSVKPRDLLPRRSEKAIFGVMPARRTPPATPDLFSSAAPASPAQATRPIAPKVEVSPAGHPAPARYLLPGDLPDALARLNDGEIDSLLAALICEAKRRGRLPSGMKPNPPEADRPAAGVQREGTTDKAALPRQRQPRVGDRTIALTPGQTNAVRAAFKAGVKPSAIAREFRISRTAVRQVLAEGTQRRKS